MAQFIKLWYATSIRPKYENSILQSYCQISFMQIHSKYSASFILYLKIQHLNLILSPPCRSPRTPPKEWSECPHYSTDMPNECFFNKKHTFIWSPYTVQLRSRDQAILYDESLFTVEDIGGFTDFLLWTGAELTQCHPQKTVYKTVISISPWVHLTERLSLHGILDRILTLQALLDSSKPFEAFDSIGLNCEIICHCKSTNIALKQYSELLPKTQCCYLTLQTLVAHVVASNSHFAYLQNSFCCPCTILFVNYSQKGLVHYHNLFLLLFEIKSHFLSQINYTCINISFSYQLHTFRISVAF